MSGNVEQRIKEMKMVQDMLKIAMADEAEEDDEVKEEAEKKMEETMADLRNKLEEARRNEGKEPIPLPEEDASVDFEIVTKKAEELQAGLDASHEKITELETELAEVQAKMRLFSDEADKASQELDSTRESTRKGYSEKLESLGKEHELTVAKMTEEHTVRLEELTNAHAEQLEKLKLDMTAQDAKGKEASEQALQEIELAKQATIQAKSAEAERALDELRQSHEQTLQELEADLKAEIADKDLKIVEQESDHQKLTEQLKQEIESVHSAEMKRQLDEQQKVHEESLEATRDALNGQMSEKDAQILDLRKRHEELLQSSAQDLEAAKSMATEQGSAEASRMLEERQKTHDEKIRSLEENLSAQLSEKGKELSKLESRHQGLLKSSEEELATAKSAAEERISVEVSRVLEEQKQSHEQATQDLQEKLIAELEAAKSAAAEHGSQVTSRLLEQQKEIHGKALKELEDKLKAEISDANAKHEESSKKALEEVENARSLATEQGASETARLLDEQKRRHAEAVATLEDRFKSGQAKEQESASKIDALNSEVTDLKNQLDLARQASAGKSEIEGKLRAEISALADLNKVVKSLQNELQELTESKRQDLETVSAEKDALKAELDAAIELVEQNSGLAKRLEAKETEISGLSHVVASLQDEVLKAQENRDQEIRSLNAELSESIAKNEESERLGELMMQLEKDLAAKSAEIESLEATVSSLQKQVLELEETKGRELSMLEEDLQQQSKVVLDESKSELRALEEDLAARNGKMENLEATISSLQKQVLELEETKGSELSKLEEELQQQSKIALDESKTGLKALEEQLALLTSERDSAIESKEAIVQQLDDETAQSASLKKTLEKFGQKSQGKDEQHASALARAKDELDKSIAMLDEQKKEQSDLLQTHNADLEKLKASHSQELEALRSENDAHPAALSAAHAEHAKTLQEAQESHTELLEKANTEHQNAMSELQNQVLQHRESLADAENKLQTSQERGSSTERQLKEQHENELDELRMTLAKSKSDSASAQEELASTQQKVQKMREEITQREATIQSLQVAAEEHANRLSDAEAFKAADDEKREKERKSGAEVRDSLVNQLSEATDAAAEAEKAKQVAEDEKNRATAELQHAQTDLDKARKETRRRSKSRSKQHQQELEAVQLIADREREQNAKLKQRLSDDSGAIERQAARLQDVEAALKATEAELTVARTRLARLNTGSGVKNGLGESRWASEGAEAEGDGTEESDPQETSEGTELGSHIEGAVGRPFSCFDSPHRHPVGILTLFYFDSDDLLGTKLTYPVFLDGGVSRTDQTAF